MKKVFSLCLICLLAMSAMAQRAAVMEFKAGVGISQADVDGLSGIFTTYFRPTGYTMIERTQIDRIIDEQRLQRSSLTESQMVRIGQLLNLSKIIIGDVNIVMGQYNVDVRVINVESGTIAATEGATFAGTSYRETMKNLAQKLAGQIAIGSSQSTIPQTKTWKVGDLYDVKGIKGIVFAVSSDGQHGRIIALKAYYGSYNSLSQTARESGWRLPTRHEMGILCYDVKGIVNESLFYADGDRILVEWHWVVKNEGGAMLMKGDSGNYIDNSPYLGDYNRARFVRSF